MLYLNTTSYVQASQATVLAREKSPQGVLRVRFSIQQGEKIRFCPSSPTSLGEQAMLRDRYEESMVYLDRSTIPGAGEGLFARKDVSLHTIVAFFNGLKIPTDVDYGKELFAFDEVRKYQFFPHI